MTPCRCGWDEPHPSPRVNVHPALFRHRKETAQREGIPFQVDEIQRLGETETGAIQAAREGAATIVMIP